jgi:uncharacterized protein YhfF
VAAILDGSKTSTTGLADEYERGAEPLPKPGEREAVLDSAGRRVAVIETVDVRGERGDSNFTVNDDTLVVAQTFRLIARL